MAMRAWCSPSAACTTDLEADLEGPTSRLVITELVSAGRVARGERFDFRRYRSRVVVRCGGMPVYVYNLFQTDLM